MIETNRLLSYFIPRLSNDMKIAVQKNHVDGLILYRSLDPSKKRRHGKLKKNRFVQSRSKVEIRNRTEVRIATNSHGLYSIWQ